MTLREKLVALDEALTSRNFSACYQFVQEYRAMIAQCVENEYPSPNHITDAEQEVRHDMHPL